MRLDTANRSFFLLLVVAFAPFLLLGMLSCGVLSMAALRFASDGSPGWSVAGWPAIGFLGMSAVGSALGVRSLWRQRQATIELCRFVDAHRVPTDSAVRRVATEARVWRIQVVDVDEPFSFTYGIRQPRVVLSRGLLAAVDDQELRAVLAHERYHVRNLDPFKVVVARAVPSAFFFLPALRHLRFRYLAGRELAADRRAVGTCGRRSLVGALYKVVGSPSVATLSAAAAIGGTDLLEVRLAQLEHGHEPPLPRISRLTLASTTVAVALMSVGLGATVLLWVSPAPDAMDMGSSSPMGLMGGPFCAGLWLIGAVALYRQLGRRRPTLELTTIRS